MATISPEARRELVVAAAERYQQSTAAERRRILDEFIALTGLEMATEKGTPVAT